MKIFATRKRRFNQLICTNLATPSGFSWNQLEPPNSNSPRNFWTDLVFSTERLLCCACYRLKILPFSVNQQTHDINIYFLVHETSGIFDMGFDLLSVTYHSSQSVAQSFELISVHRASDFEKSPSWKLVYGRTVCARRATENGENWGRTINKTER